MLSGKYVIEMIGARRVIVSKAKGASLAAVQEISDGRALVALERVVCCEYDCDDIARLLFVAANYFSVVRCEG